MAQQQAIKRHLTTAKDTLRRLEIDIFPQIGAMPISAVTHQHMIAALRKIESRGAHELHTASRQRARGYSATRTSKALRAEIQR